MMKHIDEAIKEFNKYRDPLIVGKLLEQDQDSLTLEFTGHFCRTCGFYDYFEDFLYVLLDTTGLNSEIEKIEETQNGAIVKYSIKKR
ncbi:hypothetical protein GF319_10215 [Candidatus Bathyarchaeota archaeon]|nr:hypothetical protein [Candidatus Bathyarchaeota archaeon]